MLSTLKKTGGMAVLCCLLIFGWLPGSSSVYAAQIELYTPYAALTVPPGESINYSIEVMNSGTSTVTIPLQVIPPSADWQYELNAGGRSIQEIAIKSGESQSISLQLQVPLAVDKGSYSIRLNAGQQTTLPLKVNVSEQGTFNSELTSDQANMMGYADTTFQYSLTLRNRTVEEQTYALSAGAQEGWDIRFKSGGSNITSVAVAANSTQTISVEAIPPQNAQADTYVIPILASNSTTSAETELEAVISGTYAIHLSTADDRLSAEITAGGERKLDLIIKNTGTVALQDVSLSSNTPVGWQVSFEPSTLRSIEPGQNAAVQAVIKADQKALAGDYVLNLTAASAQKSSSAALRMSVKTSVLWGWIGILIIAVVAAGIYYLFRKYGRR